ncbi:GntR family transcriptional regulator [Marinobacterium zhoushanense]|nr:GntR family transcriptional regulator [Marinobacterium zhoushanense]
MSTMTDARLPRYYLIRDELHKRILNGEWKPGELIDAESALADRYGVALGTMRKAIAQLVSEGFLERRHGVGTFVRRANFESSLFRFFRFTSASGERVVPESQILDLRVVPANEECARHLELSTGDELIAIKRLRLLEHKPVQFEEIYLPKTLFEPLLETPAESLPALLYPWYEECCDQVVASAHEELSVEKVSVEHAHLLGIETGDPVILIERLAHDIAGRPIEWRRSRGAAERFRYHIDIR